MENKSNSFSNNKNKNVSIESKVIPLGFYTLIYHERLLAKEVSLNLFGLNIDFGVILPYDALREAKTFLHVYRTLNVDTSGNVGKEAYGIYLFGRRGLSVFHGYVSVPIQSVSNLEDLQKIVSEYVAKKDILGKNIHQIFLI